MGTKKDYFPDKSDQVLEGAGTELGGCSVVVMMVMIVRESWL